jgi:hypothetical protein
MSTALLDTTPKPPNIARLPRNTAGYPIPWFVAELPDGTRDFRIADQYKHFRVAEQEKRCWICGQPRGRYTAFVIGPMCAVNRISAEPPSHVVCAQYAATVCPFLTTPRMRRRDTGLDELGVVPPAGTSIPRNPGVSLVWVTRDHSVFLDPNRKPLWDVGKPHSVQWLAEGREATRAEVLESIRTGLPLLTAQGLDRSDPMIRDALKLVPGGLVGDEDIDRDISEPT